MQEQEQRHSRSFPALAEVNTMPFTAKNFSLDFKDGAAVMAVINLTPDSFYEGSRYSSQQAVEYAKQACEKGAAILDIGAQSTAPDSTPITDEEEIERLIEPLKAIRKACHVPISVDTFSLRVAKAALENGADIINDVSGKASYEMAELISAHGAGWIVMHTGGLSSAEERNEITDIKEEINSFFEKAIRTAEEKSLSRNQLCLDPGIGFGKSREDDLDIIANFYKLKSHGCAKLAALSRKRVTKLCGDALTGTVISNAACIAGGADIIRVHDIEQGFAAAKMAKLLTEARNG